MRAASTNVSLHKTHYFLLTRARIFCQQRNAGHYHAGGTIGALHRVGLDECLLQRVQFAILFQSLDGGNLFGSDVADSSQTGPGRLPVYQYSTCAALTFTTAVFASGQVKIIAQNTKRLRSESTST